MTDYTRILSDFVTQGKYEDFPVDVVEQTKLLMLDTLGCAIAGYTQASEEVGWLIGLVKKQCPGGNCSIIGDGTKTSPGYAALVNGGMVHTIDYDDIVTGKVNLDVTHKFGKTGQLHAQIGQPSIREFIIIPV